MRYRELIENTDDDDLFAKPLADRIRARLAELEDQDMMEPDDMIETVAEEFNLEVEQVYDLLDDEVYENTDDDDLFGGRDRKVTPEQALAKFKTMFPVTKRVSWSKMHFRTVEQLFDLSTDQRLHAGESYSRHSYWGMQGLTNRQEGLALMIYEDSGAGTWAYLGAQSREDLNRMVQQLIAADQLEDPEAAKQRRLAKQQGRAATIEKKGIRVGTKIDIGGGSTAEVVEIKPTTGKVKMKDITGPYVGHEREYSVYQISKRMIMSENDDDDDLFAEPRSYMFMVVAPDDEIISSYTRVEDAIARARAEVDDYRELGYQDDDAITVIRYKEGENQINFDDPGVTVAAVSLGSGELAENFDDDDMFATPKIAFNDVFNEYDEDELMAQGFQYGDHPEQDIEILNDYLEGYRDFRVVGLSGGEHDLVLHLDRSSKLKETDDDELFGADSVRDKISQRLHKLYKQILYEADDLGYDAIFNHCKQFAKMWDRYDDQLSEDPIEDMAMKEPVNRLSAAIVELEKVAADPYEYIYENTDDELFGSPAPSAAKIGKLLGAAGITSGEIVDPESVNMALHRIAALDKYRVKAEIMQQQWLNVDEDTAWNMVDDIANVVYDINGDGWEPDDTIYNESDDELFGKKWHERINMSSIEIDGVDHRDSPDFSDAHVSYAEFDDGKPLNNEQLEWLTNELGSTGELHELVWDSLHEDRHAL